MKGMKSIIILFIICKKFFSKYWKFNYFGSKLFLGFGVNGQTDADSDLYLAAWSRFGDNTLPQLTDPLSCTPTLIARE
jgi:hypothetical protein